MFRGGISSTLKNKCIATSRCVSLAYGFANGWY